ncbi:hypothetical protein ACN265_32025 [Micromonospora sp. WMMD730]|uniref:hypothetical protein n=1 Tax=Micromonospora sp. WMMD730 TaxID=3404128 RepID=UPI003B95A9B4
MLLVLPDVDEPKVIPELVLGLRQALHRANSRTDAPVRLRAALTQGVVHEGRTGYVGRAVVAACRIVDSDVLRKELAKHNGGDLALAVADDLHRDVVDAGYAALDAGAFHRIDVRTDKFEGKAWVHLPPRGPVPEAVHKKQILTGRIVAAAVTGTAIGAVTIMLGEELAELLEDTTESVRPTPTSRSSGYRSPDLDDLLHHDEEDSGPEPHLGGSYEEDDEQPH